MSSILLSTESVVLRSGESVTIRALSGRQVIKFFGIIGAKVRADGTIDQSEVFDMSERAIEFLIRESITSGSYEKEWRHLDLEDLEIVLPAINQLNFPEGVEKKVQRVQRIIAMSLGKPNET